MTRKDYELIAHVISVTHEDAVKDPDSDTFARLEAYFAAVLAADNPRFDRAKFLAACGIGA